MLKKEISMRAVEDILTYGAPSEYNILEQYP